MMQTRSGFQKVRSQLSVLTKIYGSAESTFLGLTLLSESPRRKFLNNQLNVDFIADNAPPSEPSTPLNTSTPLAIFLNHYYLTPQTKMTQIQLLKLLLTFLKLLTPLDSYRSNRCCSLHLFFRTAAIYGSFTLPPVWNCWSTNASANVPNLDEFPLISVAHQSELPMP